MSTYTQILYHIVFGTKYRARCLQKGQRTALFNYILGDFEQQYMPCVPD